MADKYNRKYTLVVQTNSPTTEDLVGPATPGAFKQIQLPFSIDFDIIRNTLTSTNIAKISVKNLNPESRNQLLKNEQDFGNIRTISLQAGYGTNLPLIFKGNISRCFSVRQGVEFITQFQCFDAGAAFINSAINQTFPKNYSQQQIIDSVIDTLASFGVTRGAIDSYLGTTTRGAAYGGSSIDILSELTGGGFFIDNMQAHALTDDAYILEPVTKVINAQSGLISVPLREQGYLEFDMLFEPDLFIGKRIQLESALNSNINGYYKVLGIHHRGTISETICGDAITTVTLDALNTGGKGVLLG